MNSQRFILPVALMALSAAALGQSDATQIPAQSDPHGHNSIATSAPKSEAQKSVRVDKKPGWCLGGEDNRRPADACHGR